MEFLKLLESIRNPVLDAFFSFVTHFGEETVLMIVGLIFFWCISKKQGYYILFVGFFGTVANQFLKLWFRIPRPWVKDPTFTVVESAVPEATGYSFPSGHTQTAVGTFGAIARARKELWLRIICVAICILVPVSRMYLGVHTLLDVTVSAVLALLMVFLFYPLVKNAIDNPKFMRAMMFVMCAITISYLLFVHLYNFPSDIDMHNYESGLKNGYKILGCFLGIWLSFELDVRFVHFDTKAPLLGQILKVIFGGALLFLIKTFLKQPLYLIIGNTFIADGIRYFVMTLFGAIVWPLTFKFFKKIGRKNT